MTTGELLKEYRIAQGKNQKEFINDGMIVSQSYYSKVEKNINKITVDNLVDLLHFNNISIWEFFSRLNSSDKMKYQTIQQLRALMSSAYYNHDFKKLKNIKNLIDETSLSSKDKEEEKLLVDGWLESTKHDPQSFNKVLRDQLKDKIFNRPSYDKSTITLYCNFMAFYDLESNETIATKIINRYKNTQDVEIQRALLAIIGNILALAIVKNKYTNTQFFIETANKIATTPELFFYKNGLFFFENWIKYKTTKQSKYLNNCRMAIDTFKNLGMEKYGNTLQREFEERTD
ncbi:helix-turn-helix domain-containing protein [uncultured Lactobacillus sp.]|uniref:helix-turn-helix domain-containing protein n=1 Tax=uncultured Lactobacillus sp. TaxID=153152 RepID=UPI0026082B27|nr:Rgg/GadR/MutR family transcriptional regulator [uncultured Lactobacillus sp.]